MSKTVSPHKEYNIKYVLNSDSNTLDHVEYHDQPVAFFWNGSQFSLLLQDREIQFQFQKNDLDQIISISDMIGSHAELKRRFLTQKQRFLLNNKLGFSIQLPHKYNPGDAGKILDEKGIIGQLMIQPNSWVYHFNSNLEPLMVLIGTTASFLMENFFPNEN